MKSEILTLEGIWEHPNLVLSNNTQVLWEDISHNGDE